MTIVCYENAVNGFFVMSFEIMVNLRHISLINNMYTYVLAQLNCEKIKFTKKSIKFLYNFVRRELVEKVATSTFEGNAL